MPRGVHGSGVVMVLLVLRTSSPRLYGCMPSASLVGLIALMISFWLMCFGSGSWTMYPLHAGLVFMSCIAWSMSVWVAVSGRS